MKPTEDHILDNFSLQCSKYHTLSIDRTQCMPLEGEDARKTFIEIMETESPLTNYLDYSNAETIESYLNPDN